MKTLYIVLTLTILSACSNNKDWVCKSGVNNNGEEVQYSENSKTGEIAAYYKCKQ